MNYRHVYMIIIHRAKTEQLAGARPHKRDRDHRMVYYEWHHILPRSIFPKWTDNENNTVPLTAREHFFCHQLITKIYPCREMVFALFRMANCSKNSLHRETYKINSHEFERIKVKNAEARKGLPPWNKGLRACQVAWNKGLSYKSIMTKEERKKFAPKNVKKGKDSFRFGTHLSEESKQKISESKKGSVPWNKGSKCPQTSGKKNGRAHKCVLLNTGEIFDTIADAKKKYPMARHISECCQGTLKFAGKLDGEKLRWAYGD